MPPPVIDYDPFRSTLPGHAADSGNLENCYYDEVFPETKPSKKSKNPSSKTTATVAHIVPSYEGYLFTVMDTVRPGETASWVRTRRHLMPLSSQELYDKVMAYKKASGLGVIHQFQALGPNQQAIVRHLIDEKNTAEKDHDAVWNLFGVRKTYKEQKAAFKTWRVNDAIRVTIRRSSRASAAMLDLSGKPDKADTKGLETPHVKKKKKPASTILYGDRQDNHEYGEPRQNFNPQDVGPYLPEIPRLPQPVSGASFVNDSDFRYVEDWPEEFAQMPQPVFFPFGDRQPRTPIVLGHHQIQARHPSSSRGRRSVDTDETTGREARRIADVVDDEVRGIMREVATEDNVLDRRPTRSRSGSLRSTRLAPSEDFWSNAGSSSDRRLDYSTPGTSPDQGERYYDLYRPDTQFRRRDSSGARTYADDRERYYVDRNRNHVVRPHETYREHGREPSYPRDRRQGHDDYPPDYPSAPARRQSRERQYDRPRVQRRVTDYPEAFQDADFGRPLRRGVISERTPMYDWEDRQTHVHEERRGRRNATPNMAQESNEEVDSVAKDAGIVSSPSQTRNNHNIGEQQHEPEVPTSPETTVVAEEMVNPNKDVDERDLDRAGSVSSPRFGVPAMINPNTEEEIAQTDSPISDNPDLSRPISPSDVPMALRSGIDSPISDNPDLSRPISPSWSATGLGGYHVNLSRITRFLPLRGASPLSAERYISSETGPLPLFEQSENDQNLVSFESALSTADLTGNLGALAGIESTDFDTFGEHHQQVLRQSRRMISINDFDDDDQSSCAESVFSQESTASTATSLGGSLGSTGFLEMVNRTASALFAGDVAQSINSAALGDPGIGPERYRRNIRRMIKTFGKSLRAEADTFTERRVAVAMQTRRISTHVAHEIMTRVEGPRPSDRRTEVFDGPMDEEQRSDTSTESADEDEVVLTQEPEDEAKIRNFVLDSSACMQFKKTLLDFVHRPYEKRIMTALNSSPDRTASHDKDHLVRVAREISWIPTNRFSFSHDRSLATSDLVKGLIEDTMGESWDWSPLGERKHRLRANHCRLSWRTPDGRTKHVDLPEQVEVALLVALNTAPAFVNTIITIRNITTTASGNSAAGATSNSSPAMPLPMYQAGGGSSSISPVIPQIPLQPLGVASSNLQSRRSSIQGTADDHYIYLCVDAGTRSFIGVNCNGIQTDVDFFNKLKTEYDSARGWFRLWFSTWCYAHCDFWIFQQIALGGGARLEIGFPTPTDPLYHYLPKPLETPQLPPHGPISHDEFNLHYYHQVCPSLLSWERWHRRQIGLSVVEKGALEAAPKRIIKLDMQSGGREKFYGLYAKEARSALRVAIHMSVCCLPGVIFFFLWLYQWGHGADLQGAAVPVQLSLTLVAGYLGVLYWTR